MRKYYSLVLMLLGLAFLTGSTAYIPGGAGLYLKAGEVLQTNYFRDLRQ